MRLKPQTYAVSTATFNRRRLFQRTVIAELFIATLFRYRDAGKYQLHAFVVMPDHIHVLLTPSSDMTIERCMQLIKVGFSFAARKEVTGELWQEGYHAHRVTDAVDFENQAQYIARNPQRKHMDSYPHVHTTEVYLTRLDPPVNIA